MIKNKEVIIQSNTEQIDMSKYVANDMTTHNWQPWPVSPAYIEGLCKDIIAWACDEEIEAVRITDFAKSKGTYCQDMDRMVAKYPQFAAAYKEAKTIIGSRRERGAIFKRYDGGMVRWGQHWYGEEWKGYDKFHADLKKMQDLHDKIINAIIQAPAQSDLVNEKLAKRKKKKQ